MMGVSARMMGVHRFTGSLRGATRLGRLSPHGVPSKLTGVLMLSRSLCRSWGLHWLSGVKLRAYDGSMMGVSARMMGVHRFNVLCAFRCFARYYITAGCAVLCPQSAGFAPPQTPPKADRHTTPAPLACRIFELSLCGWAGILHCG